jgi:hypothetical protein
MKKISGASFGGFCDALKNLCQQPFICRSLIDGKGTCVCPGTNVLVINRENCFFLN